MEDKGIVIPGDFLSEDIKKAGEGTYVSEGKVYSSTYGILDIKNKIRVVPLSGKYIPAEGDIIIGTIKEITFSNWIVDINSPYEGLLHISEYPRKINPEDMIKYLKVGDSVLTLVKEVNSTMKVELTLNDHRLKPIKSGRIIEISPTKVPRVIGRGGSMITLLKNETGCNIYVGQNGRVWIVGKDKAIDFVVRTILKIEKEAHISGLTDRIVKYLKKESGKDETESSETAESEIQEKDESNEIEEVKEEISDEGESRETILNEILGDIEKKEE